MEVVIKMRIERLIVGMGETNAYIVYDDNTLEAFIIDPGDEAKAFTAMVAKKSLKPLGIILTHYHYDHIGAVEELRNQYSCPVYIHKKDVEGLKNPEINHSVRGFRRPISITPDETLLDGHIIKAGDVALEIIHTPGHTRGGICLKAIKDKVIFTGDTLFKDEIGRMDLEGGSEDAMRRTLANKVSKWDDDTIIYPGHGDCATMDYVKRKNREFLYMLQRI